jgi:hypothetical protein
MRNTSLLLLRLLLLLILLLQVPLLNKRRSGCLRRCRNCVACRRHGGCAWGDFATVTAATAGPWHR